MATDVAVSSLRRKKTEEYESKIEEPAEKRLRTEKPLLFPLDKIISETDINDVDSEMEHLENTDTTVKCGVCGKAVRVFVQNRSAPNIIHHFIFQDSSSENSRHQILKLMCCAEGSGRTHVAALLVIGHWWSVESLLTANDRRNGLMKITTFGERIVLSVLNKIIFRHLEHSADDPIFLSHPHDETAIIMWKDGKAIGFYSIKLKGKLINVFLSDTRQMNVLDTIFVRKRYRHQGLACRMLEHFLDLYPKQDVGLSHPVEKSMLNICKKVLSRRPADKLRMWECNESGYPQRRSIWLLLNRI